MLKANCENQIKIKVIRVPGRFGMMSRLWGSACQPCATAAVDKTKDSHNNSWIYTIVRLQF